MYDSIKEIVEDSKRQKKPISELIIEQEVKNSGRSRKEVWDKMKKNLDTMRAAVKKGQEGKGVFSKTRLNWWGGGQA